MKKYKLKFSSIVIDRRFNTFCFGVNYNKFEDKVYNKIDYYLTVYFAFWTLGIIREYVLKSDFNGHPVYIKNIKL